MRILFVTSEIPYPPVNGTRLASYHAMRLMARDNKLMLASLVSTDCEPYNLKPLEKLCEKVLTVKLAWRHPASIAFNALWRREIYYMERFRSEEFRKQLKKMIAEFTPDVIHFDRVLTTQYIDCAPRAVGTVASINDSGTFSMENAFKQRLERSLLWKIYRWLQYYQIRNFEKTWYPKFDIVHTMTENDGNFLRSLNPEIRTEAIPNGTSIEDFSQANQESLPNHVVFVGRLSTPKMQPLVEFLNIAWSKIRRNMPHAVLHIVGREMKVSKPVIEAAEQVGGVQFEGFVEHLPDAYSKAGIAIVPINKNCGLINKAIEAMAAGLCVVGFHKTFEGIPEAKNGENCLAVESFEEMGNVILDMMNNKKKQLAIRKAARETAVRCFSWESRRIGYQQMYKCAANLAKSNL